MEAISPGTLDPHQLFIAEMVIPGFVFSRLIVLFFIELLTVCRREFPRVTIPSVLLVIRLVSRATEEFCISSAMLKFSRVQLLIVTLLLSEKVIPVPVPFPLITGYLQSIVISLAVTLKQEPDAVISLSSTTDLFISPHESTDVPDAAFHVSTIITANTPSANGSALTPRLP
ncbi:Uncharacterised protein [uncultured archaeon]|nr:Uncharacterised protein [uncultured archaeon]